MELLNVGRGRQGSADKGKEIRREQEVDCILSASVDTRRF